MRWAERHIIAGRCTSQRGDNMYDILIIGAGPAGLTAAIYGIRAGMSVLVLESMMLKKMKQILLPP